VSPACCFYPESFDCYVNGPYQMLAINANEPDAKSKRDQATTEIAVHWDASDASRRAKLDIRNNRADRQAIERGEDEGMIVRTG
jgi:hypothetical protein